jgi:hypothetical protein
LSVVWGVWATFPKDPGTQKQKTASGSSPGGQKEG